MASTQWRLAEFYLEFKVLGKLYKVLSRGFYRDPAQEKFGISSFPK